MFSRVGILNLEKLISFSGGREKGHLEHLRGELDWLIERNVIFDPEKEFISQHATDENYAELQRLEGQAVKEASIKVPTVGKELDQLGLDFSTAIRRKDGLTSKLAEAVYAAFTAEIYKARRECIRLRQMHRVDAYPVLIWGDVVSPEKASTKDEVIKITLESLPIPDESTPWEQIIEYRSDPDSQSKFLALRNWMSEVARAQLTPAEVEEKLEYLIDQYKTHMKYHRMKTNTGLLETIITTGAEMLGGLLSNKWGKIAQALFSLKKRHVVLLEGELTSPGREIAYIVKVRETF